MVQFTASTVACVWLEGCHSFATSWVDSDFELQNSMLTWLGNNWIASIDITFETLLFWHTAVTCYGFYHELRPQMLPLWFNIALSTQKNVQSILTMWLPGLPLAGLNNSIGPIARDCPKWPSGNGICVRSCPPNLCGWIFGQPIFFAPNYCSIPTNNGSVEYFRIEQYLCWFFPWSHINCVQFIVYLDHIIIVLVPLLKYWWRSSKSTTLSQIVRRQISLLCTHVSLVLWSKM